MSANIRQAAAGAPVRGEAFIYKDANFSGQAWAVTGDVFDFTKVPGLNDQISSIKVGPNTKAFLFVDDRYNGDILRVTENEQIANLTAKDFNDKASSIIIATFDSA